MIVRGERPSSPGACACGEGVSGARGGVAGRAWRRGRAGWRDRARWAAGLALGLGVAGCGGGESETEGPGTTGQPAGWDEDLRLAEAADTNGAADVVEVSLTARVTEIEIVPGTKTPLWTYDGRLPGPLIRAKRGDRLLVHFTNELPEPTTIHWHGVRVPVEMDGAPDMPKPAVKPGETFDYDFVLPDAGLYWYHPHVDSAAQLGRGLHGALLVEDADEPPGLGDELILVLTDIGIDDDGTMWPQDGAGDLGALFGREGNRLLVNGRLLPELRPRAGLRQRWRIVNAAKSRYFWMDLGEDGGDGDGDTFVRVGGDGGFATAQVTETSLLVVPGERADVLVTPVTAPGEARAVRNVPYDRGYGTAFNQPTVDLFKIRATEDEAGTAGAVPDTARAIEAIDATGAMPVEIDLTMKQTEAGIVLGMNGVPFGEAAPIVASVGETQVWTVRNTMAWAHPFHLHGFFFQVVDEVGAPVSPLSWKDTVDVPVDGEARFVVRYDPRPGMWMFHCHILDHADLGMMGMVDVRK